MTDEMLTTKLLTPELWPSFEALFGANGACGGCWCMHWRIEKGEAWDEVKGEGARMRMKALVMSGRAEGLLAFHDGEPAGWCAFGRRKDFVRLERSRTLACDDADKVWSIPCFFIARRHRGIGVAARLLRDSVELLKKRGVAIVEGYPVRPAKEGKMPAAFAWTGLVPMFAKAGFDEVGGGSKVRMRLMLSPRAPRSTKSRRG